MWGVVARGWKQKTKHKGVYGVCFFICSHKFCAVPCRPAAKTEEILPWEKSLKVHALRKNHKLFQECQREI